MRSTVGFVPDGTGLAIRNAVGRWLARHRRGLGVLGTVAVAALLIASPVVPRAMLPLVLGPVVAVILTVLVAPPDDAGPAS